MGVLPAIVAAAATATAAAATTTAAATTVAAAAAAVVTAAAAGTATASTTAAVATTAAAATTTEATAAAAAAALLALLGLVDAERATIEGPAVHAFDGLGGLFRGAHRHEREAARAARFTVGDEVDIADGSKFLERATDAIGIGVEREISNVQTSVHRFVLNLALDAYNPPLRGPWCSEAGFWGETRTH